MRDYPCFCMPSKLQLAEPIGLRCGNVARAAFFVVLQLAAPAAWEARLGLGYAEPPGWRWKPLYEY